jgi:acetyl esterase/lipase
MSLGPPIRSFDAMRAVRGAALAGAILGSGCSARSQVSPEVRWSAELASAIKVVPNVSYGPLHRQTLDFYLQSTPLPPPVLINFHGGGWTAHSKEEMNLEILPYLALGFAVANVEYRLANEALAPAAIQDARCALHWVIENGGDYYVDPTRVVLAGSSAGGHLALMAGMAPPDGEFDADCPGADPGPVVRAILNWCGPIDLTELTQGPEPRDWALAWLGSGPDLAERARRYSPLGYVHAGGPPVVTVHGEADSLIPYSQAVRLHAALSAAEVKNRLVTIAGGGHGGFGGEATAGAMAEIQAFLAECDLKTP